MAKPLPEHWRHMTLALYGYARLGLEQSGLYCGTALEEMDKIATLLAKELDCETKDLIREPEPPRRSAEFYKTVAYRDSLPRPGKYYETNGD